MTASPCIRTERSYRSQRAAWVAPLACAALVSSSAAHAAADAGAPRPAEPSVTAGLYALYGNRLDDDDQGTFEHQYGPGLALRAGGTYPGGLYLGASLHHFFGGRLRESVDFLPPTHIERTGSQSRFLGIVGYDLDMTDVSLRPNLGAGYSFERNHVKVSGADTGERRSTAHGLVISPGIEALIPIGLFSLCIELRHDTVLLEGDDPSAAVLGFGLALEL